MNEKYYNELIASAKDLFEAREVIYLEECGYVEVPAGSMTTEPEDDVE